MKKAVQKQNTFFWDKWADKQANVWVTTLVVLAVVVFLIAVVTLPGQGLKSDAAFFRSKGIATTTPASPKVAVTPTPTTTPTITTSSGSGQSGSGTVTPGGGQGTTTPPTNPGGSPGVTAPVASSQWPVWSIQTIRWSFPAAQGIGLMLKKGGKVIAGDAGVIAWPKTVKNPNGTYSSSGGILRNNGAFNWVVTPGLTPGNDYQVQVVDQQGQVLGESPAFSIAAAYNGVTIRSVISDMEHPPTSPNVVYGVDANIKFFPPKFAGHLDVAIYVKSLGYNGLSYITQNVPPDWITVLANGDGVITWSVSDNVLSQINGNGLPPKVGDDVEVILSDRDNPAHSAHFPVHIVQ